MAQATITNRTDWPKSGKVDYTVNGKSATALFWQSESFAAKLTKGATVELTFEKKPKRDNPEIEEVWITSVNGESSKPKGGGGGGRPGYQPKSAIEIHASCIAGIIKSAIEQGDLAGELAKTHLKIYEETVAKWS